MAGFLTPEGEMTDEQLQQLMELGIIPDQQGQLSEQMALAQKLRHGNTPQMRQGSRVSTAAHPLEFLAAGLEGHKAGKQMEELSKQQAELLRKQVEGRKLFFQQLQGQPQVQAQPPEAGEWF